LAQALLSELEEDLLERARASAAVREALRVRHEAEKAARRTADALGVWQRHFVTQLADLNGDGKLDLVEADIQTTRVFLRK
jgi:hypothetical protein